MAVFSEHVEIQDGFDILIKDSSGNTTIQGDGEQGNIHLGGGGKDGDLTLKSSDEVRTVHINGEHGNMDLGGAGHDGDIMLKSSDEVQTVHINGEHGNIHLGGAGHDGDLTLKSSDEVQTVHINGEHGNIHLGGAGHDGDILILDYSGNTRIHLDGNTGDIKLTGADCAEEFDVSQSEIIEPGTVVVFDNEGKLLESTQAYDKKVAGVISGAGNYRPGIVLDKNPSQNKRMPVALMGKVYCKVDAQYAPIEIGDLITTSPTVGHAMKASDPYKAFGAVIGKALHGIDSGQGIIPILVSMQ